MVQICVTFIIDRVPYFYFLLNEADDKSTPLLFLGPTYVRKRGVKMFENMFEKLLKYAFFLILVQTLLTPLTGIASNYSALLDCLFIIRILDIPRIGMSSAITTTGIWLFVKKICNTFFEQSCWSERKFVSAAKTT